MNAQRLQGSKTVDELERQTNFALSNLNKQIGSIPIDTVKQAEFTALSKQVALLTQISGNDTNNGGTGSPGPAGSGGSGGGGGGGAGVATDGITIGGNGTDTPIFLQEPVLFAVRSTSTSPDAVTATDFYILASSSAGADIVENLPASVGPVNGRTRIIYFKKMDANAHNVAVTPNGTDTIDGVNAPVNLTTQYSAVALLDGSAGAWSLFNAYP